MSELGNVTGLPKRTSNRSKALSRAKELTRRARAAGKRETIKISHVMYLDQYERVVLLAERYHKKVSEIIRECIDDGLRKYSDFRSPYSLEMNQSVIDRLTDEQGQFVGDKEEGNASAEDEAEALRQNREVLAGFIPSSSEKIV
jgi:hypothetical protein